MENVFLNPPVGVRSFEEYLLNLRVSLRKSSPGSSLKYLPNLSSSLIDFVQINNPYGLSELQPMYLRTSNEFFDEILAGQAHCFADLSLRGDGEDNYYFLIPFEGFKRARKFVEDNPEKISGRKLTSLIADFISLSLRFEELFFDYENYLASASVAFPELFLMPSQVSIVREGSETSSIDYNFQKLDKIN